MSYQRQEDYVAKGHSLCSDLGILKQLKSYPQSVSGGELQRAALVRSLMNNPKHFCR